MPWYIEMPSKRCHGWQRCGSNWRIRTTILGFWSSDHLPWATGGMCRSVMIIITHRSAPISTTTKARCSVRLSEMNFAVSCHLATPRSIIRSCFSCVIPSLPTTLTLTLTQTQTLIHPNPQTIILDTWLSPRWRRLCCPRLRCRPGAVTCLTSPMLRYLIAPLVTKPCIPPCYLDEMLIHWWWHRCRWGNIFSTSVQSMSASMGRLWPIGILCIDVYIHING